MPQDQSSRRGGGGAADHVLVAAADVGRDRLDDDAVVEFSFPAASSIPVVDALYFDFARPEINHSVIGSHEVFSWLCRCANQNREVPIVVAVWFNRRE